MTARKRPSTPAQRQQQFGRLLKLARERAGLTQAQLGQRVGQTQEAIAMLERSRNLPSLETAVDLALALHTSVEALMGRESSTHVIHYHTPGEVRVWVSNGVVVLGSYGPAEIERLMDRWQHWRGTTQGRAAPHEPDFPSREEALGDAPLE